MDNQPSVDRALLIPILIGGFSVVGIIIVLLIGRSLNSSAEVAVTPSATPFQYLYLGTEPAITTPLIEGTEIAPSIDDFPIDTTPIFAPPTSPLVSTAPIFGSPSGPFVSTPLILVPPTITPPGGALRTSTPTSTLSTATVAGTYDDTDSRLAYVGTWISQTNVSGAHQGTLHVSTGVLDSVSFTFTGQEIHLFYQAGPSLGAVTITIDGLGGLPLDQSQGETQIKEWVSDLLTSGTHSIVIAHYGGGSVNLDSLVVPAPTPTPTRTPTP